MATRYKMLNGQRVLMTDAEEAEINVDPSYTALELSLIQLRNKRNRLLQASDWEIMQELEKGNAISDNMKTYRQALRDLPNGKDTVDKCNNATWPTKP